MTRFASLLVLISCLWSLGMGVVQSSAHVDSSVRAAARASQSADSLLLDQYPNAYAAYSLRKLRSDYSGSAIRVRRSSDNAKQDIGFTQDGWVDTAAISNFVGSGDGYVTVWYAQVEGTPNMATNDPAQQPRIAQGGTVETDPEGNPALYLDGAKMMASGFDPIPLNDYTMWGIIQAPAFSKDDGENTAFGIGTISKAHNGAFYRFNQSYINEANSRISSPPLDYRKWDAIFIRNGEGVADIWQGNTKYQTDSGSSYNEPNTQTAVSFGGFTGTISELVVGPHVTENKLLEDFYESVASDWNTGPVTWNQEALLPQAYSYQVTLYDWLETLTEGDVTLPDGTISWDGTYANTSELADLWLLVKGLSASSVTRSDPGWYVLDDGSGKGIEATGNVKIPDEPRGGGDYGGNPPRSWSNEPALLYKTDIPLSGGGQGNPWYQNSALGRRAMVVAMVDMMMHHRSMLAGGASAWYDMKGKAMLGWAEAYRWAGDVLPSNVRDAFEKGFSYLLEDQIERGPRAVNTNMDMFALQAYADLYMATDNSDLKQKTVQAAKAALFGYTDGELETNHKMFAAGGNRGGGVFSPSGAVLEGDQPEVFYHGESLYQLVGALQAVTDRSTGNVQSDWSWLEEVVRRAQEWRTYQMFYDPDDGRSEKAYITGGAGFSGRTSHGVPNGQAGEVWKSLGIADRFPNNAFKAGSLPSPTEMSSQINNKLSYIDGEMSSTYTGTPDNWNGWSPWTKHTPYLPLQGWYRKINSTDPELKKPPVKRSGATWNKTLGGPPTGKEYWSYKQKDNSGEAFGFFVETVPKQGTYGGWYGGKIETFWTESTGVVLINRHGKSGCDRTSVDDYNNSEDSKCWFNLDSKAGHHVWGRDENGNGFTTLLLRGRKLSRTSTYDVDGTPPTVAVNNVFNDPSQPAGEAGESGEETGSEIEGNFEVENKFLAQSNGLKVTHTLTSDETDQVTELWASIPVYLRHYNPYREGDDYQENMEDTSIDYYDGSSWNALPEDLDSDGTPEIVSASALRLGRDYGDGSGPRYAYIAFPSNQDVRRSKNKYYDPYQSKTGVRTVHIDLHGNPGTAKTLPADKSVSYTIQTTDPTTEEETSSTQTISLQQGWNLVSVSVTPSNTDMDSIFAGLSSDILVVNENEQRYWPEENVNEIGTWDTGEAYSVYVDSETTLSVQGTPISSNSVVLEQGWNWVPYLLPSSLPVEEALSSVADQVVIVKDEAGRAYLPDQKIDKLEVLKPGEGYKIYVSQQATLAYPDGSN